MKIGERRDRWRPSDLLRRPFAFAILVSTAGMIPSTATSAAEPQAYVFRVTGLFEPDRVDDLRAVVETLPDVRLESVDYDRAEARFTFDPAKLLPGAKPEQVVERFDQLVRQSSSSTFGIRPPSVVPRERWQPVTIPIVGLDCRACSLAADEIVLKVEGVEQAQASFRDGVVRAWIDPTRTTRAALEEALKKRNVQLGEVR